MEFSWRIFLLVATLNALWFGLLLLVQARDKSLPPRGSLIPGTRQKFLHAQDFYTMTWGDLAGVPFILGAFVQLVSDDLDNLWRSLPLMVVSALAFRWLCLRQEHKPDYGFPSPGKISAAGRLHLAYFGLGIGASLVCLWNVFAGKLAGSALYATLCGAAIYAVALVAEIRSGNFDPLRRS